MPELQPNDPAWIRFAGDFANIVFDRPEPERARSSSSVRPSG